MAHITLFKPCLRIKVFNHFRKSRNDNRFTILFTCYRAGSKIDRPLMVGIKSTVFISNSYAVVFFKERFDLCELFSLLKFIFVEGF